MTTAAVIIIIGTRPNKTEDLPNTDYIEVNINTANGKITAGQLADVLDEMDNVITEQPES